MEFLDVPYFDDDLYKLLVRFGIDLFFLTLIVVFGIFRSQRNRDFAFTAVMLNVVVFFICFTMKKLELDLGLALGLFAVFGVLRYRTDSIRPKEMTYLFIVIGIAVINALSNKKTSYAEIGVVNFMIFATTMLKERVLTNGAAKSETEGGNGKRKISKKDKLAKYTVEYDRLEWLGEESREQLLADLRDRTRMNVVDVEVKSIDLAQNKVTLTVWVKPLSPDQIS